MQVIVVFFATRVCGGTEATEVGVAEGAGDDEMVGAGAGASCESFTLIVGLEYPNPLAVR